MIKENTIYFDHLEEARDFEHLLHDLLTPIQNEFQVELTLRDGQLIFIGKQTHIDELISFIQELRSIHQRIRLNRNTVQLAYTAWQQGEPHPLDKLTNWRIEVGARKPDVYPRTVGQQQYVELLNRCNITFGIGPAGTGKTYLAMAKAVSSLLQEEVSRIILTRPAIEAGESLGFLPGDFKQKVDPYLRPLFDALHDMLPAEALEKYMERGIIEVAPLAYMRGRTLNHAYIILDEAQNTTRQQMLMFLTRLGYESKCVVTGDPSQIDLPNAHASGLLEARAALKQIDGLGICELSNEDVIRHPLIQRIIEQYDAYRKERS